MRKNSSLKRRKTLVNLVLFLLIFMLCACGSDPDVAAASEGQMILKLEIDQEGLANGRIILLSTLTNITLEPLRFLPWNTPFEKQVNGDFLSVYSMLGSQKNPVSYSGRMVKRAPPVPSDFVEIPAKASLSASIEITNSYSFCSGLDYIIEFRGVFYSPENLAISFDTTTLKFSNPERKSGC